jgi:hypothetical protein
MQFKTPSMYKKNFFCLLYFFCFLIIVVDKQNKKEMSNSGRSTPPLSKPVLNNMIFDNAAVGHQLAADRNDMLAPGNVVFAFL